MLKRQFRNTKKQLSNDDYYGLQHAVIKHSGSFGMRSVLARIKVVTGDMDAVPQSATFHTAIRYRQV
jgi:hypothetical protein